MSQQQQQPPYGGQQYYHHHHHHHHQQPSPPQQQFQPHHNHHYQHHHHQQQQQQFQQHQGYAPPPPPPQQEAHSPQSPPPPNAFGFSIPTPQQKQNNEEVINTDPLKIYFDSIIHKNPNSCKDGLIGPAELADALSDGKYKFSGTVAEKLVKMFDRSGNGKLDFQEYKGAHDFIQKMSAGFRQRDADGSGVLEVAEVRDALASSGYRLSEPALQLLMRKFSDRNLGGIKFDQYTHLSILLARATQVFSYYDKNRSGLVTFCFDTFISSAMSCS